MLTWSRDIHELSILLKSYSCIAIHNNDEVNEIFLMQDEENRWWITSSSTRRKTSWEGCRGCFIFNHANTLPNINNCCPLHSILLAYLMAFSLQSRMTRDHHAINQKKQIINSREKENVVIQSQEYVEK